MEHYSRLLLAVTAFLTFAWADDCFTFPGTLPCKLHQKSSLDCRARNLAQFPTKLTKGILSIDLSCNKLTNLPQSAFSAQTSLKIIRIKGNQLTNITGSPFGGLLNLKTLDLSWNKIVHLALALFQGLYALSDLDLSGNLLASLHGDIFHGLLALHTLDLSSNWFTAVPTESLALRESLEYLNMKSNLLQSFEFHDHAKSLSNLKHLALGVGLKRYSPDPSPGNINLTNDTFKNLAASPLENLELECFGQIHMESGVFKPLTKLKNLSIPQANAQVFKSMDANLEMLKIAGSYSNHNEAMFPEKKLSPASLSSLTKFNTSLSNLTLSASLVHIQGAPFQDFPNLRLLNLRRNTLQDGTSETFKGLDKLETLDMSSNGMRDIPWKALSFFTSTTSLKRLLLSDNRIRQFSFTSEDRKQFISLQQLDFSNNEDYQSDFHYGFDGDDHFGQMPFGGHGWRYPIRFPVQEYRLKDIAPNLEWVSFKGTPADIAIVTDCTSMTYLDFSACKISDSDFHQKYGKLKLPHLKTLKLSGNSIEELDENTFKPTPDLKMIDMSSNDIRSIETGTFSCLKHLTHLNLEQNRLLSIDEIQPIPTATHLNFAQNLISTIPPSFFSRSTFPNLQELDISGNSFECDNSIQPFNKWIRNDAIVKLEPHYMYTCVSPQDKLGMSITDVGPESILNTPLKKFLAIGIPCIFVVVVAVVWSYWYFCARHVGPSDAHFFDTYHENGFLLSHPLSNGGKYQRAICAF